MYYIWIFDRFSLDLHRKVVEMALDMLECRQEDILVGTETGNVEKVLVLKPFEWVTRGLRTPRPRTVEQSGPSERAEGEGPERHVCCAAPHLCIIGGTLGKVGTREDEGVKRGMGRLWKGRALVEQWT